MIGDIQSKLLEVLAPGGLAIASIFFAVLVFLYGAVLASKKESERRPIRWGIGITFLFTLASLFFSTICLYAIRYQTWRSYRLTLWSAGATLLGMAVVAAFVFVRSLIEKGSS